MVGRNGGLAVTLKEPFAAAMRRPDGMISSEGFKDDPRWRGGRIKKPDVAGDIVIRPRGNFMPWAILVWGAAWGLMFLHPIAEPLFVFLTVFFVMYMVSAVPKLFLERTIITPAGIERVFGPIKTFFPWENFHNYTRDSLGINLRMIRPWGIWLDDYNFIVSNLYYSSGDIMKLDSLLYWSNNSCNSVRSPGDEGED